jgi:hypothetical protein
MRHTVLLLAVAAAMAALMMASATPAFAEEKPTFIPGGCFHVPPGNPEVFVHPGTFLITPSGEMSCIPHLL